MKKIALCLLCCLAMVSLYAQKELNRGNKAYGQLEYFEAIGHYEKLLSEQYVPEAAENLAHCYRFLRRSDKASYWYEKVLQQGDSKDPNNPLYLAQALLSNGKPEAARPWAQRFAETVPADPRGEYLLQAINNWEKMKAPREKYTAAAAAFNLPENDDFAPFKSGEQIYFTSDRGRNEGHTGWSGRSYTRLFQAAQTQEKVQPVPGNINSQFHDGAACISSDGREMYFTRNNVKGKQKRQGSDQTVHLILVKAERNSGEWQLAGEFPYNSVEYSVAYPTLSRDGKILVFASDGPGGQGGMDLYISRRNSMGSWSSPENLGREINTPGAEVFPFLLPDGTLVFSSDGLPGMGGQDLFRATSAAGKWIAPENLGAPLNSPKDEFGFWSGASLEEGWFSSNRNSPQGLQDIFYFTKAKAPNQVIGLVVDKYTQIPLKEVAIAGRDRNTGQVFKTTSGEDGQFKIDLPAGSDWNITIGGVKNDIATTEGSAQFESEQTGASEFVQLEHNDPRFTLEGYSLSSKDKQPVEGTLVKLLHTGTGETKTAFSGKDGKFSFQLDQKSDYRITGEKNGYYSTVAAASTRKYDRSTTLYVKLFLYTQVVIINEDITMKDGQNPMNINDIYYDFDDYHIRSDAARELDKLVAFLKLNSNLKVVQLSAHTDSRGKSSYNRGLSEKRAEAAVDYLVNKGIPRNRLRYRGYGESDLTNRCKDGVTCAEAEHQKNRRTELRVLKMGN